MADGAASSPSRIRRAAEAWIFGNPLYRLTLGGRTPAGLAVAPSDPWPGDPARGEEILAGVYRFGGQTVETAAPPWRAPGASPEWLAALHGFEWLRDLRAVGGDDARRQARTLAASWIERHPAWDPVAWEPAALGARLASWIGLHDFFCASADDEFRAAVFASLARQARHLRRMLPGKLAGLDLLTATRGLIFAAACLTQDQKAVAAGLRVLERELPRQIQPDGGHVGRSPSRHLTALRRLIDIRSALRAARLETPEPLQHAIDRMAPALRFFRHGDGGLALFNDSFEEAPALADMALAQADARGRPLRSMPHSGFERLSAGRTLLLVDVGAPPLHRAANAHAHAGLLSFEMSVGRERLIVNCGAYPGGAAQEAAIWRDALRGTAAHSTLGIDGVDSVEIKPTGLGRRPSRVRAERQDVEGASLLTASHDGYGILHERRIYLAASGEDLRGEDRLQAPPGTRFAVRFHLHPQIQAAPVQNGAAVLLRLHSGAGWRFLAAGGTVSVEDSVYFGDGAMRRSAQIVVSGVASGDGLDGDAGAAVKWALRREKKPA